jgi:hypothetical protein
MALLRRRLPAVLLAAVTLVLLTGCVKLDVDLTVGTNDKVSGTYIIGIDRSLLQFTGQDADALYQQLSGEFDASSLPEGRRPRPRNTTRATSWAPRSPSTTSRSPPSATSTGAPARAARTSSPHPRG